MEVTASERERVYGHCRACHMNCAAYFVVEDGKVVDMEPVSQAEGGTGHICERGLGSIQLQYSPTRVLHPLKRVGKRGEGKWEQISWEQAISEVAQKIYEMSKEYGPETFALPGRTGRQDMGWVAHRIARTIGTPNNYFGPQHVCCLPRTSQSIHFGQLFNTAFGVDPNAKLYLAFGNEAAYSWPMLNGFQAAASAGGDFPRIVLDPVGGPWPLSATEWLPIRPGTDLAYLLCLIRSLIDTDSYEVEFVKTWTNAPFLVRQDTGEMITEADTAQGGSSSRYLFIDNADGKVKYWDAENIQWEGGVSGREHYEKCLENFSENIMTLELSPAEMPEGMDPALFGEVEIPIGKRGHTATCVPAFQLLKETVQEWTPEKTAEVTGLDVEQIKRTCELVDTLHPIDVYEGTQYMATNSGPYFKAINVLRMLTGSVDASMGSKMGQLYPITPMPFPGEFEVSYQDGLPLEQQRKRLGYYNHRMACGFAWEEMARWHPARPENSDAMLICPDINEVLTAAETGVPYPIHGIISIASNWIMHDPSTARIMSILEDEDKIQLHVVSEIVMTPTAEMADYVFPAQTWMERNYLEFSVGGVTPFKNAFRRAVEPLGEARHDYDFGAALAHKLEEIDPRYNNDRLLNSENTLYWGGEYGKLWENDTIDEERDRWCREFTGKSWEECLDLRKVEYGAQMQPLMQQYLYAGKFPTDTGKCNLFSTVHQHAGYDPFPVYEEPAESPISRPDLAEDYPLIFSSGKRQPGFFHSEFRQLPWIREISPMPEVFINPETAAEFGVTDGDWIWIESPTESGRDRFNRVMGRVSFRFAIRPGVVSYAQHAWWRPERAADQDIHGAFEWNVEGLLECVHGGKENGTPGLRSSLCKIYRCSEEDIARYKPVITREELENLMPNPEIALEAN
ncbi:molybdopterin-dependent oxidoreductase [Adlercreutzia sp. ZJ473]|uniref:molybdopterin-containing oxidoreductase family protein n=1 Tax=Adlercreutzia sp. ZJ473 TaxID=2722822 RepID=UPI0015543B1D|nr:molybdopterin-dependent oxidoreductase [Adlercreutzia sp. ZJ473]